MRPSATIEFMIERDDEEIELVIEGDIEPYVPAKLSGPPENCYPAEGGYAEITKVEPNVELTEEEAKQAEEKLYESYEEDFREAEAEAAWERWKYEHDTRGGP